MWYSNFFFYVMKISYDLSSPIFQHLIFVEWAIEIQSNKSDMNMNFFCFFGRNTMQRKVSKSNICKFKCVIKYEINHDLPPFC